MILLAIVLGLLLVLVTYLYLKVDKHFSYWKDQGIPHDKPSWILGSLKDATVKKTFTEITHEYYNKYRGTGPFAGFYWFLKPAVFLLDPELIKLVLIKDFSKFSDRGMFCNPEDDPLSGQLFNLDGHKWRHMRNKLSPTFTSGKMKLMYPLVTSVGKSFVKVFNDAVEKSNVVEVKDLLARFTTDVIGTCAFGLDINSLHTPNTEFRNMSRRAFVEQRYGVLGLTFRFSFPQLAKRLHMKETMADVEKYFLGIARDTVDYREKNNVKRNDFMDMLIELKNNKLMKSETGDEMTNLSFGELAAQAFVFLLAGFETSSTTLGFALYELAKHQDIQQKAREEVQRVLAKHNQEFTYDCMKEMVYVDQVIAETLRHYTVLPLINRQALEDYPVPGHPKYVIKKGMTVLIPAPSIHMDERYYPEPRVFNPDNFTPEKVAERSSVLYLAFGDGPRNCIGMRFGKMQTLVGLALLLNNFKFSTCAETPIPLEFDKQNFLNTSQGGIPLKVEKIRSD